MRKKRQWIWWVALAALAAGRAFAAGTDGLRVLLPVDRSCLLESRVIFSAVADPGKVDTISAGVNKNSSVAWPVAGMERKRRPDGMASICAILTLDEGENTLTVQGYFQGKKVAEEKVRLFYATRSSRDRDALPPSYRAVPFHTTAGEALCADCHQGLITPLKRETPLADSPCLGCHPSIAAQPFKHGPVAVGDCISCHDAGGANKYTTAKPLRKLCYSCHEEAMKPWEGRKYIHGPTATGDCSICHDPHSSSEKFFLTKKMNALCIVCHEEKAIGGHVISSYVFGNSHPLSGDKNPMKPDRAFSCASCHSPHAANTREIFAFETQGGKMGICQACHKK